MLIYAMDSRAEILGELTNAIRHAIPTARVRQFTNAETLLRAVREVDERPDAVFSDVVSPGNDGLALAAELKEFSREIKYIFVTEDDEFAVDAFQVHADGYLLKPLRSERIVRELEFWGLTPYPEPQRLRIQCFGKFEVFWDDIPLSFKRRRTKEMFAYLIDRNGAAVSAEEMTAILWEDESNLSSAKHNLRNLLNDLRTVLDEIGQSDVLIRGSGTMAVNRNAVDCDYFRLLDGENDAISAFRGEYMNQYFWARSTEANLHFT